MGWGWKLKKLLWPVVRHTHWLMHHRRHVWILCWSSIVVTVATSQETVKLSLKVDAATAQANGLQDTWLLACGYTSSWMFYLQWEKVWKSSFTNQLPSWLGAGWRQALMFQSILVDHVRFCKLLLVSHSLDSILWSIDGTIRVLLPAFQETDASDLMLEGFRWSIGYLPKQLYALLHVQLMSLRCSHLLTSDVKYNNII